MSATGATGFDAQIAEIRRRRAALVERIDGQRATVARSCAALATPIAIADRAMMAARFVRDNPALVGVATAVVVAIRLRRIRTALQRGFALWRGVRAARGWLAARGLFGSR
jgi:hypothetical protein